MTQTSIVKRRGHSEAFDERKAYASIYWAARSAHVPEKEAEKLAAEVTQKLVKRVHEKHSINSDEIFSFITEHLTKLDKDAGYMYKTHRDLS